MRHVSTAQTGFAIAMIGVGIVGVLNRDLMPVWNPAPGTGLTHDLLVWVGILVSLLAGVGLLVRRMAALAARLLLATLLVWMLLFRLPNVLREPLFAACWSVFPLAVTLGAAMAVYVRVATAWDTQYFRYLNGESGLRIARVLYGLSLVFFGLAHFIDLKDTLSLVPHWLPFHLFWAYFTGCTYLASGIAVLVGVLARLAAALSAVQIGSFLFLIWIPIVAAGSAVPFQWSETFLNVALLAGAWVIADSYSQATRPAYRQAKHT
jgi:uncharacterized membrane protein YphA (DoxX/SURF4 family)